MSLDLTGAANSNFTRQNNAVTNTGTMTYTFWFKRTGTMSGLKFLLELSPSGGTTSHLLGINDPNLDPNTLSAEFNWAATQVYADPIALNEWTFIALVGSGANISLKYWDGTTLVTETVAQTAFAPEWERWGGNWDGSANLVIGRFAHIRCWNAVLTDNEILAEKNSATAVKTTNLKSSHTLDGGSVANAVTGQTGAAYTAGAGVAYSSDMPTIDSFTGVIITGEADMPAQSATIVDGARYNRWLWSGDLTKDAVWKLQGNELIAGAAAAPGGQGTSQRIRLAASPTGGIYGLITNLPAWKHVAIMAVRRVDTNYMNFRHMSTDFGNGAQGHFDLVNGGFVYFGAFGSINGEASSGWRALSNGWFLIWIAVDLPGSSRHIEFYPMNQGGAGLQALAPGKSLDVAGFQHEDYDVPHYHKPTQGSVVSRTFASLVMSAPQTTVPLGFFNVTATALDNTGAPWDQYEPVDLTSSNVGVVNFPANQPHVTDLSGKVNWVANGAAAGTANITAVSGDSISSSPLAITVTATQQTTRWVRIRVEAGWHGTSGWAVGVYQKHATQRFPTVKHFEALNQVFKTDPYAGTGESYMDVAVPGGVTLTAGTVVEVAMENDNVNGSPADAPGIIEAVVI